MGFNPLLDGTETCIGAIADLRNFQNSAGTTGLKRRAAVDSCRLCGVGTAPHPCAAPRSTRRRRDMDREDLIREYRLSGASWPALLVVYGLIIGTLVLTGMSMT
jgi:hypothetical protein